MKPEPFIKSDSAISAVISAVLILGLLVTVTTVYQVRYVPVWKGDAECSHLADVYGDMANLKSQIDILANHGSSMPVSVPITMGGGDIPVIGSGRSSGTLSVNDDNYGMRIYANNMTGMLYDSGSNLTDLGSISYRSCNNYYMDQMFEYENGALILVQDDRSLIKLMPAITLTNISVTVDVIEIAGDARTISSNAVEEVYLTLDSREPLLPDSPPVPYVEITVFTKYPDAWARYFNATANGAELVYGIDYTIDVGGMSVKFCLGEVDGAEDITLCVRKSTIEARLDVM